MRRKKPGYRRRNRPAIKDKVWSEGRTWRNLETDEEKLQTNGFVRSIDWEFGEVCVEFYSIDTEGVPTTIQSYEFSAFHHGQSPMFGGLWKLEE